MSHDPSDSCFVQQLSYYVKLTGNEKELLSVLEREERQFTGGREVLGAGAPLENLYVVKSGWLYSYTIVPDGRRHIAKFHHPGDIIGLPDIPFQQTSTSLHCSTEAVLCPFPRGALEEIFKRSPRLTALFFALAMRDHAVMFDRLKALGRMSARERIAHLLLELMTRLRITNQDMTSTFRLPLTQTEIGDAVGLTNVYVSKSLGRLREEGFIERSEDSVTIKREDDLRALVDFEDRFYRVVTDWFPD